MPWIDYRDELRNTLQARNLRAAEIRSGQCSAADVRRDSAKLDPRLRDPYGRHGE